MIRTVVSLWTRVYGQVNVYEVIPCVALARVSRKIFLVRRNQYIVYNTFLIDIK